MLVVKDTMVIIHLAKTGLLQSACKMLKVIIPQEVYNEVLQGKEEHPEDTEQMLQALNTKSIKLVQVSQKELIKRANQFNIEGGEAEAVALYWQERADKLATDDDNVRKKKVALGIKILGTPAIIIRLLRKKHIGVQEYLRAIRMLRSIAWFSSTVYDTMLQEVKQ